MTVEEAVERLAVSDYDPGGGETSCVHTFRTGTGLMLGAHWPVEKAREAFEQFGVKEVDGFANHNLLVIDDTGPVIFETKEATP